MSQQKVTFEAKIRLNVSLKYLLHLPKDYDQKDKWPLILFLHGRGERGDDLDLVKKHGLPRLIEEGQEFPFIVVSPQCPLSGMWWLDQIEFLNALLDDVIERYKVDTKRIYLTGLSMGGAGTWYLAGRYPERFAAIAPICGAGMRWLAEPLAQKPIWVFHGDADTIVPVARSQEMVEALKQVGNNPRFTVYPGVDHNSWDLTYSNPELYSWFLSHTL